MAILSSKEAPATLSIYQTIAETQSQIKSCVTSGCHGEYQELSNVHGPVALGMCLSCHEIYEDTTPYEGGDDHWFDLVENDGNLCLKCHDTVANEAFVHYPIRRNKCIACHDPHGSDNPGMMRHEKMADNCLECHEPVMDDDTHVHAPVRVGACTVCHDPHGSANPFQTVAAGSNLCLGCHTGIEESLNTHRHVHRPVLENCAQCHTPHDANESPLLKASVPDLCLGCHTEMAEHIENSTFSHGALDQKRSCLECHNPHVADFSRQLRKKPIDLCLGCHDQEMVTTDRVLRDMKAFLATNPDHHGPIRSGDCSACHNPHGAEFPFLLDKAYPEHFYQAFDLDSYSLCFNCHEQSLVVDPETATLTNFRNGMENLHFTHVNRERKGRTCRACHDVHASTHPKHIADVVPFGSWAMPIQYEILPEGGSCSPGCHETRSYDRTFISTEEE
jgi:predicted CXXCH cytochrome family protein